MLDSIRIIIAGIKSRFRRKVRIDTRIVTRIGAMLATRSKVPIRQSCARIRFPAPSV
jgi:hypothetical protein